MLTVIWAVDISLFGIKWVTNMVSVAGVCWNGIIGMCEFVKRFWLFPHSHSHTNNTEEKKHCLKYIQSLLPVFPCE